MTKHTKAVGLKQQSTKIADLQASPSQVLADNLKKLESYTALEPNWNGNDAGPFETVFINYLKNIVSGLQTQPQIFPTGRNTVQLEYDKLNDDSLELEIYPDGLIESIKFSQSGTLEENITEADLNTHINAFHAE